MSILVNPQDTVVSLTLGNFATLHQGFMMTCEPFRLHLPSISNGMKFEAACDKIMLLFTTKVGPSPAAVVTLSPEKRGKCMKGHQSGQVFIIIQKTCIFVKEPREISVTLPLPKKSGENSVGKHDRGSNGNLGIAVMDGSQPHEGTRHSWLISSQGWDGCFPRIAENPGCSQIADDLWRNICSKIRKFLGRKYVKIMENPTTSSSYVGPNV